MRRLIDEDAVKRRMHETMDYQDMYLPVHFEMCMNDVPTVEPASPWHRVEEELPKDRETVLIYCENTGGIVKSHYHEFIGSGGKKHYWFSGGTHYPKYWMPLPEPPKEDA